MKIEGLFVKIAVLLCPANLSVLSPRERLEVGCCQLAHLEQTLEQCQASVHREAESRGWL